MHIEKFWEVSIFPGAGNATGAGIGVRGSKKSQCGYRVLAAFQC